MKEIVIISGKGGTGKTSVCAALASLASAQGRLVSADCDVDAADLHLIYRPEIEKSYNFISGKEATIDESRCTGCGLCAELCRFDAIFKRKTSDSYYIEQCEGCGLCVSQCPEKAIDFLPRHCGHYFESSSRFGPLIHAQLLAGAENSGKLVTQVRRLAQEKAKKVGADWILVDGSPGIGCPVIASISQVDAALAVSEASLSGKRDLGRIIALAKHFKVKLFVVINKSDINTEVAKKIENMCQEQGIPVLGQIAWDPLITQAQIKGQSAIEFYAQRSPVAPSKKGAVLFPDILQSIWKKLLEEI